MPIPRELLIAGGAVALAGLAALTAATGLTASWPTPAERQPSVRLERSQLQVREAGSAVDPLHAGTAQPISRNPWNPADGAFARPLVEVPPPPPLPLPVPALIPLAETP